MTYIYDMNLDDFWSIATTSVQLGTHGKQGLSLTLLCWECEDLLNTHKGFYPIRNHCGYEVAITIIRLQSRRKGNNNPTYKKIETCVYESGTSFVASGQCY